MWRYRELLPVGDGPVRYPVPVGGTPLLPAPALRQRLGAPRLWIKDETRNPTASNKDRATALVIEDGLRRGSPPDLGRVVVDVQAGPRELRPAVVPAAARAGPVDHHSGRRPPGERGRHQAQQRRRHRVLRPMARVPQPGATGALAVAQDLGMPGPHPGGAGSPHFARPRLHGPPRWMRDSRGQPTVLSGRPRIAV